MAAHAVVCAALARAASSKQGEVTIGEVRVQALSPNLVRVEPRGPKGFEDRSTFMVVNRSFPGVSAELKNTEDGKVVRTEFYDVVLRGSEPPACGEMLQDTDVETDPGGTRSSKYPDGILVPDSDACCAACASDPTCNAWVYTVDLAQCYTLNMWLSLKKGQKNRVFGVRPPRLSFEVRSASGAVLYDSLQDYSKARHLLAWPAPLAASSYALVDHPRFHQPEWGATPVPPKAEVGTGLEPTSGYDFDNGVEGDTYVFLLGDDLDGWMASRAEFAALTGPVPVLPDYAYGTWFTWWHPYDEEEAKDDIEQWDTDDLPLDVWGLDMNWRHVSDGKDRFYDHPNTDLFSNFDAFFSYLRGKGLRTFFNDHPFPVAGRGAGGLQTSPEEVAFRWEGLTTWMARGLDFWWFDVNWGISIPPPTVNQSGTAGNWLGLGNAAWGSHVYFTIVDRFHRMLGSRGTDNSRGVTLTKFARDDARPGSGPKGSNRPPESPAQHRYPVWWTGDNVNLQASVESMVDAGVHDFKPFVHSDCGGDKRGSAGDLLRWTAHCAFGTILRYHGEDHRPWSYDGETEDAVRSYLRARYKLLPTLIAAGREATSGGFPLAARGDLFWPLEKGSSRSDQYISKEKAQHGHNFARGPARISLVFA
ncbi:unnamed protein product [Prorocentrum cordatum]|uniref:Alpha-glucosidase n=1 Tax=Prorocentrum cordatum TaxID=2364126 RepID=A0ABN9PLX4_9DINO|nr:unnamed protein product [Polarella glacialis]